MKYTIPTKWIQGFAIGYYNSDGKFTIKIYKFKGTK